MKRLLLFLIIVLILGLIGAFSWATSTAARFMSRSQADSIELLSHMEVDCPPGTTNTGHPHGKAGWAISCEREGVRHGPWLNAEVGRLEIRGQYSMGSPCGEWQWYDPNGVVFKRKTYSPAETPAPGQADE